jgi:Zn ribbon nucleic-acid-binding protein
VAKTSGMQRSPDISATRATEATAICPLCGSLEGRVLIQTDEISFVECPSCAGEDLHFWVTRQAGERAEWMRRAGHSIDPRRTRWLIGARRDRGGSALVHPIDVDEILRST